MSSTTPNSNVDASTDAALIEADDIARKDYNKKLRVFIHVVLPVVVGATLVMVMSTPVAAIGMAALIVSILLLPAVAIALWLYHWQWSGRRITQNLRFYVRAITPAGVMLIVSLVGVGFLPLGRIVRSIVGDEHQPVEVFMYPGLPFLVAYGLLGLLHFVGVYSYIGLFAPLTNRQYSLATTQRRINWWVRMVLATIPFLLLIGANSVSQL